MCVIICVSRLYVAIACVYISVFSFDEFSEYVHILITVVCHLMPWRNGSDLYGNDTVTDLMFCLTLIHSSGVFFLDEALAFLHVPYIRSSCT